MGVPQGSPLPPVIFVIWMAPTSEKMEEKIKAEAGRVRGVGGGIKVNQRGDEIERKLKWNSRLSLAIYDVHR